MDNLLYYPYINVPRSDWTARALLYYEEIGTIVPQRFFNAHRFDEYMTSLVQNNLVTPIDPLQVLDNPWNIAEPFLHYLQVDQKELEKRRIAFQVHDKGRRMIKNPSRERIHADKFDSGIFYRLQDLGLAIPNWNEDEWYEVEKKTAGEMMTFLASVVGRKIQYMPVSDKLKRRFKPLGSHKRDFELYRERHDRLEIILNNLLPFPHEIDLKKLAKFKRKNALLLRKFKNEIEKIVMNEKIETDSSLFKETIKRLKVDKEEITARMNEDRFGKIFYGRICGIASGVIAMANVDTVNSLLLGVPAFLNAIYSALALERPDDVIDQTGMKYLALIDRKLA